MATEVNERTTFIVTVSFFDEDGAAVVPSAATYRLDAVRPNTRLVETTEIGALAAAVDIEFTPDDMRILRNYQPKEQRKLTVEFDYGEGRHGAAEYIFWVKNLYGVS